MQAPAISAQQPAATVNQQRPASRWIVAPVADLSLIVATPLIVWGLLTLAQQVLTPAQITSYALVWAIGHHLPGMLRAYGDRALFQRFRIRFIVAPLVLLAIGIYSSTSQSSAIPLAVGFWGLWHYLMQAYGFLRIYDSKVQSVAPLTCLLDRAMCLVWFIGPVMLTDNGLMSYLNLLYRAGGPLLPPSSIIALRSVALVSVVVVTGLFLINTARRTAQGNPPSPVKLLLMVTTFGYYWYCLATVSNLLVSYALFELFHDVQYLTIVWSFNEKRAAKDSGAGSFTRFLFRRRGGLIACYIGLIVVYGLLNFGTREYVAGQIHLQHRSTALDVDVQKLLLGVFVASTILHYYYDGFIWKLRESDTRRSLGLADDAARKPNLWGPRLTWGLAALGICGLIGLVAQELLQKPEFGIDRHDALAATLPNSVFVHNNRGIALAAAGRLDDAEAAHRKALKLNPNYADVYYNLGTVLVRKGKREEARLEFQKAVKLDPRHAEAQYNLGSLLLEQGRYRESLPYLEAAAKLTPRKAEVLANYGLVLQNVGRLPEAIRALERAVQLKPDLAIAHANLAQALAASDRRSDALEHFLQAVRLQPDSALPLFNLGVALEEQERLDEAVTAYRASLKIDPKSAGAWQNLGTALAKQNKLAEAVDAFSHAIALAPDNASARQNLERAQGLLRPPQND